MSKTKKRPKSDIEVTVIEKDGKPAFAVIAWEDFERLRAAAEDEADIALIEATRRKPDYEEVPWPIAKRLLAGDAPVRVWREHRGLTQQALADAAGLSQTVVARIESGKRQGSVKTLRAIADALAVGVDDLVAG
jgi:DNA-binding XRE family transcriptional regulator